MASLQSYAELAYRQIYPNPSDETSISLVEFIETAKGEYAYGVWELNRADVYQLGENNIPPTLLSEYELQVNENNIADISKVKAMRGLPNNTWIQQIGEFNSDCKYIVMDLNKFKLLVDDDSRTTDKFVVVMGKTLRFPDGTFEKDGKVPMIFANLGTELDEELEIDDAIGAMVRKKLVDIYSKRGVEDKTNNSSSTA